MESLNQLAEILAERAGRQYDIPFKEEMKSLVNIWRIRLTRDSLERRPGDRVHFRQYLEVPLIQINISELLGFPDMPVLRTECKLPAPLRANGIFFDFVGSPDKISPFKLYTEQHEILPALDARYTGRLPKALWLNEYIYVFNKLDMPYLGTSSVWEDPQALANFRCNCGSDSCFDADKPYPVSGDIKQRIIQSILSVELRITTNPDTETVKANAPS